jgi:hypothetical protein
MNTRFAFVLAPLAAAALALAPAGAAAKVVQVGTNGFVVRHVLQVPRSLDETWAVLVKPSVWWDADHTWSGSAVNLSLDPRAGGCFCEILPNAASPTASPRGSVEHMRVIYVSRPNVLRMTGALGPLQAEAATATLTIQLRPAPSGKGTQILAEYVVGGFTRTPFTTLAPDVDAVIGGQFQHLAEKLGGAFSAAFPTSGQGGEVAGPPDGQASEQASEPASPEPAAPAEPAAAPAIVPLGDAPPITDGTIVGR